MSDRDILLYITDVLESIEAIESYIKDLTFEEFKGDRKTYSATIREYIIIGEAISKTIELLQAEIPDFSWRSIKDFRNFIVHEYFGVDSKIVWDLSTIELDGLKEKLLDFKTLKSSDKS
jgi:uncharacterized protein with HEPN domain